jgi:hypothetical protein
LQLGCGVAGERLAVAEARDLGVQGCQPSERRGCLGAVDVEYAADDLPLLAAGHGVAGEQDPVAGKVQRDAAWGVAGNGECRGTLAEAELVAVSEFPIDPRRDQRGRRLRWEPAPDLFEEGLFPVGQVWGRPDSRDTNERRVGMMREHLCPAVGGDVGRGADVVGVKVRQHQAPQFRGLAPRAADRVGKQRRAAGEPGVTAGVRSAIEGC